MNIINDSKNQNIMDPEDIERYSLEGFRDSFNMSREQDYSQSNENIKHGYRIDTQYHFSEGKVDGKTGVTIHYAASNNKYEIQEFVSIFTGYAEYDIKGAIDELAKVDVPVLNYFFSEEDNDTLSQLEAVYYNPFVQPEIVQGWKIVVGPQKKLVGDRVVYLPAETAKEIMEVLYPLMNNELFPYGQPHFIKTWITRVGNDGMWADCRVNAEHWESGEQALFDYGNTWNIGDEKVSLKQVILLIPQDLEDMETGYRTLEKVKEQARQHMRENNIRSSREENGKKAWWQFWK